MPQKKRAQDLLIVLSCLFRFSFVFVSRGGHFSNMGEKRNIIVLPRLSTAQHETITLTESCKISLFLRRPLNHTLSRNFV